MYQEFFTRTVESKFIKNILYNTPLPIYKVVRDGDYVFSGIKYVYNDNLIEAESNGFINFVPYDLLNKISVSAQKLANYTIITNYNFGDYYPQFTEKYISEFGYYDTDTHEKLGDYLRAIRNLYNIDLMPFYNCYSGRVAKNLSIIKNQIQKSDGSFEVDYGLTDTASNSFKLIQIPIKFNQDYTIAMDTDCNVLITPAFIKNGRKVTVVDSNKDTIDITNLLSQDVVNYSSMRFKHPIKYRVNLFDDGSLGKDAQSKFNLLVNNERNLYLLIQIPKTESTTITVLEGDWLKSDVQNKFFDWELYSKDSFDGDGFSKVRDEQKEQILISRLSLLKLSNKKSYAFCNRLIEYLTKNVIIPLDEIDDNITYIQTSQHILWGFSEIVKGVWDDKLRLFYHNYMIRNHQIEHYDLNGYLDRDTEKWCT